MIFWQDKYQQSAGLVIAVTSCVQLLYFTVSGDNLEELDEKLQHLDMFVFYAAMAYIVCFHLYFIIWLSAMVCVSISIIYSFIYLFIGYFLFI